MKHGYDAKLRPSEHDISDQFGNDNGGAIPPNILDDHESDYVIGDAVEVDLAGTGETPVNVVAASNTSSNDRYQRRSRETGAKRHPGCGVYKEGARRGEEEAGGAEGGAGP